MAWGYMLSLDCAGCEPSSIRSTRVIEKFVKELVKEIDMVAYGEPQIVHFGSENKAGYTLVQLIETSNIVAHFCNEDNAMFIDVFSCKSFSTSKVFKVVNKYFNCKQIVDHYIERSIPVINHIPLL